MGANRIVVLIVAAVAAIALMLIVGRLISHKPPPAVAAAPAKPMTQVVVAARDLPIGEALTPQDLTWQPWPADAVNPTFITNGQTAAAPQPGAAAAVENQTGQVAKAAVTAVTGGHTPMDALYGAIVKSQILAREPVTNAKLVRGGEGGYMAVVLHPGMRAVAVPVSVVTAAGGFILPGDRVDVIQARPAGTGPNGQRAYAVQTVLSNVRVLAIDQSAQTPKTGQSAIGTVATLEVTPADAEQVAIAKAQGEMVLTLRAYTDVGAHAGSNAVRIIRGGVVSQAMVAP